MQNIEEPTTVRGVIKAVEGNLLKSRGEAIPCYSLMSVAGIVMSDMEKVLDWHSPIESQYDRLLTYTANDVVNAIRILHHHFRHGIETSAFAFEDPLTMLQISTLAKDWMREENQEVKAGVFFSSDTESNSRDQDQVWRQTVHYELKAPAGSDQLRAVAFTPVTASKLLVDFVVYSLGDGERKNPKLRLRFVCERTGETNKDRITSICGLLSRKEERPVVTFYVEPAQPN